MNRVAMKRGIVARMARFGHQRSQTKAKAGSRPVLAPAAALGGAVSVLTLGIFAVPSVAQPVPGVAEGFSLAGWLARAPGPTGYLETAVPFAIMGGLTLFAAATAFFHLRERRRAQEREDALSAEVAQLQLRCDRADVIFAAERRVVISFGYKDDDPVIEGDVSVVGEGDSPRRILAFGSWLTAASAQALETSLGHLKRNGEAFHLVLRAVSGLYFEAEGSAISGQAVLRLREITAERLELVRAHDALLTTRGDLEGLQALLDALPQPVWLRDGDGEVLWVNAAYGRAVEARDARDAIERRLELLDEPARMASQDARGGGGTYKARVAAIASGQRRTLDVVETPTGEGSAGIATDVSELEAIRLDLQRQMQAHVRTLDQLPTAVASFDGNERLVFYNAAYREFWQLDAEFLDSRPKDGEILDRLRSERLLPEQVDFRVWKSEILAGYKSLETQEHWWYLPDGRTLRVIGNPAPKGGVTYLFDDVTERVQMESRYNALVRARGETLDSLREGVVVFAADGSLTLFNPAFATIWNLEPSLLAGHPHIDAIVALCGHLSEDSDWSELRTAVTGLYDTRTSHSQRIKRPDGTVVDCVTAPLPDGSTLITFTDVTAAVDVERVLIERNDALEKTSRLRDDFVHHVSYELRSPLTNIIGFTQLLGDETVGALNGRQREYTSHITKSSAALLAIINDILDLATIDNGSIELDLGPVDARETIAAAVRGLDDRLVERNIQLDIEVAPSIGVFIADAKRVRQVLFNLLSNAVGFSSAGQRVKVSAYKQNDEVIFSVADEGPGIPPEIKAHVFDRFESYAIGSRHRGVGLGLSIVRSFVELHGGHVELESGTGRGTTVVCHFPAAGGLARVAAE
ncbi:Histidine kinase [Hyphomicrobiales bacterium]|nr:Histidine kinase [Hyphomicrobiales bacterium]CAH1679998.1 Histidine kinase [Hyphomicrobiales bacterium]